jgi:hypothetical protein
MILLVIVVGLLVLSACAGSSTAAEKVNPVTIEEIAGSEFKRVVVTEKAAERLGIETVVIREEQMEGAQRLVVPYAAVIYGLQGETWAYTNPEPLVFVREPIDIEYIQGDMAVLLDGPAVGTEIVTVGVAELYGAETGVSK